MAKRAEDKAAGERVGGRRMAVMAGKAKPPRYYGPQRGGKVTVGKRKPLRRKPIPISVRDPKMERDWFMVSPFTGRQTHRLATRGGRPKVFRGRIQYIEGYMPHSSWVFMVHLVRYSKFPPAVAIEFLDGVTCYYPGTNRQQYMTFKRRKSAGKHIHRHYYHRPYVVI